MQSLTPQRLYSSSEENSLHIEHSEKPESCLSCKNSTCCPLCNVINVVPIIIAQTKSETFFSETNFTEKTLKNSSISQTIVLTKRTLQNKPDEHFKLSVSFEGLSSFFFLESLNRLIVQDCFMEQKEKLETFTCGLYCSFQLD